jgi:trimethylamine--corrinoid protein Co-methyltransferase
MSDRTKAARTRRRARDPNAGGGERKVDYRNLRNPFPPIPIFTEDRVQAIHQTSLRVLEELGMKVLLPEAREIYRQGGAIIDEDTEMVRIGRDMVEAAAGFGAAIHPSQGGQRGSRSDAGVGQACHSAGRGRTTRHRHQARSQAGQSVGLQASFCV